MFTYGQLLSRTYYRRASNREPPGGRTYYFQKVSTVDGMTNTVRWSLNDGDEEWTRYTQNNPASAVADWISPDLPDAVFVAQLPPLPSQARGEVAPRRTAATPAPIPTPVAVPVPVATPPPTPARVQLLSNNKYYIPANKESEVCRRCNRATVPIPLSSNNGTRYCVVCEA